MFDRFTLHPREKARYGRQRRSDPPPEGPKIAPLVDVDEYVIEVWIREQVLEG